MPFTQLEEELLHAIIGKEYDLKAVIKKPKHSSSKIHPPIEITSKYSTYKEMQHCSIMQKEGGLFYVPQFPPIPIPLIPMEQDFQSKELKYFTRGGPFKITFFTFEILNHEQVLLRINNMIFHKKGNL